MPLKNRMKQKLLFHYLCLKVQFLLPFICLSVCLQENSKSWWICMTFSGLVAVGPVICAALLLVCMRWFLWPRPVFVFLSLRLCVYALSRWSEEKSDLILIIVQQILRDHRKSGQSPQCFTKLLWLTKWRLHGKIQHQRTQ